MSYSMSTKDRNRVWYALVTAVASVIGVSCELLIMGGIPVDFSGSAEDWFRSLMGLVFYIFTGFIAASFLNSIQEDLENPLESHLLPELLKSVALFLGIHLLLFRLFLWTVQLGSTQPDPHLA